MVAGSRSGSGSGMRVGTSDFSHHSTYSHPSPLHNLTPLAALPTTPLTALLTSHLTPHPSTHLASSIASSSSISPFVGPRYPAVLVVHIWLYSLGLALQDSAVLDASLDSVDMSEHEPLLKSTYTQQAGLSLRGFAVLFCASCSCFVGGTM